jgi:hypothetical protein
MLLETNIELWRSDFVTVVAAQIGIPRDDLQSEEYLSDSIGKKDRETLSLMKGYLNKYAECEKAIASKMPADAYQKLSEARVTARDKLIQRINQLSKR